MTNLPDTLAAPVPVTDADRDAYLRWSMLPPADAAAVLAGEWDNTTGMQVLARHRVNAITEAIRTGQLVPAPSVEAVARAVSIADNKRVPDGLANGYPDDLSDWDIHIATAVIAAMQEPKP